MSEPSWYKRGDYHAKYKASLIKTLYLRKRSKAMDTVWWYLTGRRVEKVINGGFQYALP